MPTYSSDDNILTLTTKIAALDTGSSVHFTRKNGAISGQGECYAAIDKLSNAVSALRSRTDKAYMGAFVVRMFTEFYFLDTLNLSYYTSSEYNDEGGSFIYVSVRADNSEVILSELARYLVSKGERSVADGDQFTRYDVESYLESEVQSLLDDNSEIVADPFRSSSDAWLEGSLQISRAELRDYLEQDSVSGIQVWDAVLASKTVA